MGPFHTFRLLRFLWLSESSPVSEIGTTDATAMDTTRSTAGEERWTLSSLRSRSMFTKWPCYSSGIHSYRVPDIWDRRIGHAPFNYPVQRLGPIIWEGPPCSSILLFKFFRILRRGGCRMDTSIILPWENVAENEALSVLVNKINSKSGKTWDWKTMNSVNIHNHRRRCAGRYVVWLWMFR